MPLIGFASPTGGTGRTTLAANVARALAGGAGRVIALDLDPQNALGMHFGLDLRDAFGFLATARYAADGRAAWRAALRSTPYAVSYLPHGQVGLEGANAIAQALLANPELLAEPVREMLTMPNVTVIADLPSGASPTLAALLPLVDLLVIPLLSDAVSFAQLPGIESGRFTGGTGVGGRPGIQPEKVAFIINQLDVRSRLGRATADAAGIHFGARLLGSVHRDEHVPEAIAAQRLLADVAPDARATREIMAVARAISARLAGTMTTMSTLAAPPVAGGVKAMAMNRRDPQPDGPTE